MFAGILRWIVGLFADSPRRTVSVTGAITGGFRVPVPLSHATGVRERIVPRIIRPDDANPQLFGLYIEICVKRALGAKVYLAHQPADSHTDLTTLFTAHAISMNCASPVDIRAFCECMNCHLDSLRVFESEIQSELPVLDANQGRTVMMSIDNVRGAIDAIRATGPRSVEIVEIKCCVRDELDQWYTQVFVYACMFQLKYGIKVTSGRIWNFLTGTEYVFALDIDNDTAKRTLRAMTS